LLLMLWTGWLPRALACSEADASAVRPAA